MKRCFFWWGFCLFLFIGCAEPPQKEPEAESRFTAPFERLAPEEVPSFSDDLDPASLRVAVERSLEFYRKVPSDRTYPLGDLTIRTDTLRATLLEFLALLDSGRLNRDSIIESFEVFKASHGARESSPLVTGYYEPVLDGRLEAGKEFCYPVYGLPPDLLTIDLSLFDPARFSGQRLVGRLSENRVVPYYDRSEIDGLKKLARHKGELVWLRDPVDVFFLHVQGSGKIRLPGGKFRQLGYAGTNGRPYRSIGKALIDRGALAQEEVTLQTIRSCLKANPEIRDEILQQNESYVFFRWVQEGPLGSLSVVLTPGRSVATDPAYHPRGALAFLVSEEPRLGPGGEVLGWEPLHRWVLNQDAGGAIKGVGRVDLFCGSGETAEQVAGRLKHPGTLYFILKKQKESPKALNKAE
ncbi:MAG: murein transglycosylase A [Deltaproteobacteria bacterium]|nr:murein transglycosylase A [Deltaproteobacteria bacterium]